MTVRVPVEVPGPVRAAIAVLVVAICGMATAACGTGEPPTARADEAGESAQAAPADPPSSPRDTAAVSAVLDDFHQAAARADYDRYFGHFARQAVFLGTDATERWTRAEFEEYARPRFEAGGGWEYRPQVRHVTIEPDGRTAWFDELLENDGYGVTRGSGVLVREDGRWKVAQYDLHIPVPNEVAREVVGVIRGGGG